MNNNPILALMENDTPDKFAEDVANAFFANPAHVRKLLNADCIESCVDYVLSNQRVEFDLSDLPLFEGEEPFFTKPSRQRGRRKHNKKEVRRKGSAKRFRDRNRKAAHEEHLYKVYDRGLAGDWNRRGRRLEDAGATSTKTSHHKAASGECQRPMGINLHISNVYYPDGSQISVEMGSEDWYTYDDELIALKERVEQERTKGYDDYDDYDDYCDLTNGQLWSAYCYDHIWDDECDPLEDGTDEFTAQELADFMQKLASATPEQRAMVRRFFSKNL